MTPDEIKGKIHDDWDVPGLIADLEEAPWEKTEPNRKDRRVWIGSYDSIRANARRLEGPEEWKLAVKEGYVDDLVDDYLTALAEIVTEEKGDHVYGEFYEGDAFLGQYRDVDPDEGRGVLDWWPPS